MTTVAPRSSLPAVPFWRDPRFLRVVAQAVLLAAVVGVVTYLLGNLRTNLRDTGLDSGYGYLNQPYGSDIPFSSFRPTQSVWDALKVGYGNTLRVASVGVLIALVLGVVIGVARLSSNFLVRSAATLYVETLRNIPIYLLVFAAFFVVIQQSLPPITESIKWFGLTVFSNRGIYVPWVDGHANSGTFLVLLGVGLIGAVVVAAWRTKRFEATGAPHHRVLWGAGVLLLVAVVAYVALSDPVTLSRPEQDGRIVVGGINVNPSYAALLIALSLYTASHIAEIVRGSIQAVDHGQTEAAYALNLTNMQRIRLVVLPQAFRIMIPPLANQFLNLTKNSSLAVAIGYYEITRVTQTAANNAAPAPQAYSVLMALYLTFSLSISIVANIINRRLRLESR
jgi:general L-amino acid transport system permease protein